MPRYDTDVDLLDPARRNGSQAQLVELVGAGARVLDVGCATGYLARALRARGCRVWGIDHDAEAAEQARPHLEQLVVADLESAPLTDHFERDAFDVLVFGDVLEHLTDPEGVLRAALPLLAEGGRIVCSIPNVAHGSVRLALLQGRWQYTETGLLDRTHLRFFDRAGVQSLHAVVGLTVDDLRGVVLDPLATEVPVDAAALPEAVIAWVREQPDAFVYQFLTSARVAHAGDPVGLPKLVPVVPVEEALLHDEHERRHREALRRAAADAELRHTVMTQRDHIIGLEATASTASARLKTSDRRLTVAERRNRSLQKRVKGQRGKLRKLRVANRRLASKARQLQLERTRADNELRQVYASRPGRWGEFSRVLSGCCGGAADVPLFTIVTPVYRPDPEALRATIDAVRGQSMADWEFVLVDDRSDDAAVSAVLAEAAATDHRVRVIARDTNGGIVAASNDGIEQATGTFIVLLDHDDLLADGALARVSDAISGHADVDYLYSDEDKVDEDGNHYGAFRKPPWSPERLRGQMYTSHLSVLRTSLVREVGGFRAGFDGSQDHDLVLRVTERARRVVHVPEVLYHWRASAGSTAADLRAKPYADDARRRAVQEHLDRLGIAATTEIDPETTTVRIRRSLAADQLVSVVIPTRGTGKLIWGEPRVLVVEAVRSLLERGGHANVEIVLVHDTATPGPVLAELREIAGDRLRLVEYDRAFNFSEKCNVGVLAASGDLILLLNDDTEVLSDNFVPDMIAPLLDPGVGITGAHLMFADTSYQHVGLCFDGGWPHHMYRAVPHDYPGPFGLLRINHEVSGVTGACIGVTRETYERVGGMTEQLPLNFNDVDFCLKVSTAGLRIVWIATAQAFHFESQTREPTVAKWEQDFLTGRWLMPQSDPYVPDREIR